VGDEGRWVVAGGAESVVEVVVLRSGLGR
jgi:hypothetical protein